MRIIIFSLLVLQTAAEFFSTTQAPHIDHMDLVLEDIKGFGRNGWSYNGKEWFDYLNNTKEISTLIQKHPKANLSEYDWEQFDPMTNGLWFFVHQLKPVVNPEEPEMCYSSASGTSKYHHLLVYYKINGGGRIDIFLSSEKDPISVINNNNCQGSCSSGFQHAMIPLSESNDVIGVHSFRLGFNTTNFGDFILVERIMAFIDRDPTLPTGLTFPSTTTPSTASSPTTIESSVTEICQCWNSTCKPTEELDDLDSLDTTLWKPQHMELMEYFNERTDLIAARNWSVEANVTLERLDNVTGVWLIEYEANETITWRPDFHLGLVGGSILEVDIHYFVYQNASLEIHYRSKDGNWTIVESVPTERNSENWVNITMAFPDALAVQVFPVVHEDNSFILIDKLVGRMDCTKPLKEAIDSATNPYEVCTCFTITSSTITTTPPPNSSTTTPIPNSSTTIKGSSPESSNALPEVTTPDAGGSCGIAHTSLFLLILGLFSANFMTTQVQLKEILQTVM